MTIKEIAEVLNLSERTIQLKAKELFPEKIKNGIATDLDEKETTLLKMDLEKKFEVNTDLEMGLELIKIAQYFKAKYEKLQKENIINKPKVKAFQKFIEANNYVDVGIVAKNLNTGRNRLFAWMRNNNILMSNNVPYQYYIEAGYFIVKYITIEYGDISEDKPKTYVTPKGIFWLLKKYNNKEF